MKKIRKNWGITLIALIVTIVILLILSGVAIVQLNNNGLLKNTKTARERYSNSQKVENATIDDYSNQIDNYEVAGNGRDTVTISKEEYENLKNINKYSTNETKIGTYIDETPIYQKTIVIKNDEKSTTYNHCKSIETDTNDVREILNSWGYCF